MLADTHQIECADSLLKGCVILGHFMDTVEQQSLCLKQA